MTRDRAYLVSKLLVVLTPVVWGAWDLYAYLAFRNEATISHFLWTTSQANRVFALAVMLSDTFLMWHWFVGTAPAIRAAPPRRPPINPEEPPWEPPCSDR